MKKIKNRNIKVSALILTIIAIFIYSYIEISIKPAVVSICEVKAKVIATQAINETVRAELENNELKEQILVPIFDKQGKINIIKTDALIMNKISTEIALKVQNKIESVSDEKFSIPLGSALDSQLLSNMGPNLTFKILPKGSVLVDFITEFEESGINQTRYKIYITVSVNIRILSPAVTSDITVTNNVLIAEIVIVGEVPQTYMRMPIKQ